MRPGDTPEAAGCDHGKLDEGKAALTAEIAFGE
jgi:hypothetical protein